MRRLVDDLILAVDVDDQGPVFLAVVILQARHEDDVAELWGYGFGEAGDFLEHQGVLCSVIGQVLDGGEVWLVVVHARIIFLTNPLKSGSQSRRAGAASAESLSTQAARSLVSPLTVTK